ELAIKEGTAAVSDQTNAGMKQAVIISPAKKDLGLSPTSLTNQPGEKSAWEYPPLSLLQDLDDTKADAGDVRKNAHTIEQTLDSFGIRAHVIEVNLGPAVAQYAIEIAQGTKLTKITSLSNDLALALAAPTGQIRIEAPIPGRSLVGVEVPNRSLRIVTLKEMLVSQPVREARSKLAVGLGLDVSGQAIIGDIATMPHALIAGTTGSGKSVMMNTLISSLLYRTTPQEVRLILVDPKRVELTQYNDIPHLLTPVIVEPDQTLSALKWAQDEMDRRYKMFAEKGARNIESYNDTLGYQALPYIVIFIDELADLMLFAAAEVEDKVTRIAQMARATGIHLILSTQRPSVNVITGLIKANIPTRVAFNVSSMVDSRVILDVPGAEKLLGRGDMLYTPPDRAKPLRVQGTYVSEKEVKQLVDFFKQRAQAKGIPIEYTEEVTQQRVTITQPSGAVITPDGQDALFEEAKLIVTQYDRASASLLQRRLKIGYARAARILDQLEATGIVGPAEGSKPREVLMRGNVGEGV
ncbi:MAG TPA: DNA translocase FtsK, partial [Patescibacteria group bacterium]|nr:DNA translocase FtsK [Patescibacteria group bacterium]